MVAVFADSKLAPVFAKRLHIPCPCVVSVCFLKDGMSFEHGGIPDTVDRIDLVRGSVNIGNVCIPPFF